jgi:3-deoxy-7-phosphoheptulonate synthase
VTGMRRARMDERIDRSTESTNGAAENARTPAFRLAARGQRPTTRVRVGDLEFGGRDVILMAGPCAVETREQIGGIAARLRPLGVRILRGGAFKPRTSPYSFQGLGVDGYRMLRDAAREQGMYVVSEVLGEAHVAAAVELVDLLQVGSRNMQNFALLKELARTGKPVLLKRGMSATYEELLAAAEYLLAGGNPNVILCERGIRTFEPTTRNTLDVSAVPVLKRLSHLPVVIDPSHAAGRSDIVPDLARASIAVGADGLLVEVHDDPEHARSDGDQALLPEQLENLLPSLGAIARAVGRGITQPSAARAGV